MDKFCRALLIARRSVRRAILRMIGNVGCLAMGEAAWLTARQGMLMIGVSGGFLAMVVVMNLIIGKAIDDTYWA